MLILNELIELACIERRSVKVRKGNVNKLYKALKDKVINDNEAALQFLKLKDESYLYQIKHQLKKALIYALFNHKAAKYKTTYQEKITYVYNLLNVTNRLRLSSLWASSVDLAKTGYNLANKINHIETSLAFARVLFSYYSSVNIDLKNSNKLQKLVNELNQVQFLEIKAEVIFKRLQIKLSKQQSLSVDKSIIFDLNELKQHVGQVKSNRFHQMYFNATCTMYQLENKHEKLIKECEQAINFFSGVVRYSVLTGFYYKMVNSYIQQKHFKQAEQVLSKCFELCPVGDLNYYVGQQYKAILGFHSGNYDCCLDVLEKIDKKSKPYRNYKETFLIIEAFVYLLKKTGKVETNRHFRLGKFLNEVPKFSKDKTGINITILVLQVMFLIVNKKHDEIIDRLDAVKMYSFRYLKNESGQRAKVFLRIVELLPKCYFNRNRFEESSEGLFFKLQGLKHTELEFFPFESLYKIILENI